MRKLLTTALAAVTAAGAVLATAAPAQAEHYRYYRHHRHGGNDAVAAAVLGGVAGLALGAALSSDGSRSRTYYSGYAYDPRYDGYRRGYYRDRGYYGDGYYRDGYYGRPYAYYERPYGVCISRDRVWDPYIQRRVTIERRYAC
jgi:hypothetical protein